MTSNSFTENEEHDIPSHILKTIFGLRASVIFETQICVVSSTLVSSTFVIPDPSGQLAELIVYITSTRVDMYNRLQRMVSDYEHLYKISVELCFKIDIK